MPTTTPTAMAIVFGLLSSWGAEDALAEASAAAVDVGAVDDAFGATELLLDTSGT
jgi:hypothetical protein